MYKKMFAPRGYAFVASFFIVALIVSACGPNDAEIQATVNAAVLTAAPPAAATAPAATPETTPAQVLACGDAREMTVPVGGQIFWSNHRTGSNTDVYAVVFDPEQGGSADHKAYGWWYQPCLPSGPERKAHEVAIVLQAGSHRFTGPECRAWLNSDGNSPWEQGKLILSRQNVLSVEIAATADQGTESWVAVKCVASWASGFSFERLEPMPAK